MNITFRYKYRDLLAFNFYTIYRSPIFIGFMVLIIFIGLIPNWRAVTKVAADDSLPFQIIIFLILDLIPVVIACLFITLAVVLGNISRMNKTILNDCSLALGNEAITSESTYSKSELKWAGIRKLARTRSHIFLYVSQNGAIVLPKRVFSNNDAFNQCWLLCQEQMKQAKLKTNEIR